MINKTNIWFVSLFSIILVLGIYYVSVDDEVINSLKVNSSINDKEILEVTESDMIVSLEVENDEEKTSLMEEYQNILLDQTASIEEKNNAYLSIKKLNDTITLEEKIKNLIKENYNLISFVKIKDNNINITIDSDKHTVKDANNIIRSINEILDNDMYITVKYR